MAGELPKDDLSADLVKNLAEKTSGISGLSVVKTEVSPGDGEPTRDASEGDPRNPSNQSPDRKEDLTPAACKGGVSVSSESIKAEEHKLTWRWPHRPIKIPKPIEISSIKGSP